MESVLISVQPKWCEKIASGKKTIEVRKTQPKLKTPFKCYIYCTKGKPYLYRVDDDNDFELTNELRVEEDCFVKGYNAYNSKVIGEFICDRIIYSQGYFDSRGKNHLTNVFEEDIKGTCLTEYELWNYIAGKAVKANEMYNGYLWHISDLKIYDTPKELSEFSIPCQEYSKIGICYVPPKCEKCRYQYFWNLMSKCRIDGKKPLERPPQSWCYVESKY